MRRRAPLVKQFCVSTEGPNRNAGLADGLAIDEDGSPVISVLATRATW
jgi:hypothetical protein